MFYSTIRRAMWIALLMVPLMCFMPCFIARLVVRFIALLKVLMFWLCHCRCYWWHHCHVNWSVYINIPVSFFCFYIFGHLRYGFVLLRICCQYFGVMLCTGDYNVGSQIFLTFLKVFDWKTIHLGLWLMNIWLNVTELCSSIVYLVCWYFAGDQ